jgi:hypothetical protein
VGDSRGNREREGRVEMEVMIILVALFGAASLVWGKDSRYGVTDPEWDRRRAWRGFSRR